MATFSKQAVREAYHAISNKYDAFSRLLLLIGFRERAYRRRAVAQLQLGPGNTVVELGCGTGMNLPLLQSLVGPEGKVVGVDFSEAMLAQARRRTEVTGSANVKLVHCDAAEYQFPGPVDGIISTFSLVFMPDYERVIRQASQALKPGKRLVVLDQKIPSGSLRRFASVFDLVAKPFAVTAEMSDRRPWRIFDRYFARVTLREFYLGFCYLAVGEKGPLSADVMARRPRAPWSGELAAKE